MGALTVDKNKLCIATKKMIPSALHLREMAKQVAGIVGLLVNADVAEKSIVAALWKSDKRSGRQRRYRSRWWYLKSLLLLMLQHNFSTGF